MKINQPNIDMAIPVPPGEILVSRTDLRGVITYVNSSFAEISGYGSQELVGAPHNIVRHPDVPPAVFEDMWQTLKRGEPWRGIVKNRSKSGRYYWVNALVTPTYNGNEIVGYVSVRRRAGANQIAQAEALYAAVRGGKPVRPWWQRLGLDRLVSIRTGIAAGILVVLAVFLLGAAYSISGFNQSQRLYDAMYEQQVAGVDSLRRIKFLMGENRSQIMLALLHDPKNPISAYHNHPVERHFQAIAANRDEIERRWATFLAVPMPATLRPLTEAYWRSRQRYVEDGLKPAMAAIAARADYLESYRVLVDPLDKAYKETNAQVDALIAAIQHDSERTHASLNADHAAEERLMYAAIVLVVAFLCLAGLMFFRGIMRPLEQSIDALSRMARGDLSRHPEVRGVGETRRLMNALAISQAQLHAILDQLAQNSSSLSADSARLNQLVRRIADGTDEQHERIHLVTHKMEETSNAMASLSEQAELLTGNAAHATTVLVIAERDMSDALKRMHTLTDAVRRLQEQSSTIIASCRVGLDRQTNPAPDAPTQNTLDLVDGINGNLQRVGACLSNMSARLNDEEPALLGLGVISNTSWGTLKEISTELGEMARELTISTRLQSFAYEDIHGDIRVVADFLVNNRGASHEIWATSSQVLSLATALEELIGNFNFVETPPADAP